MRKLTFSFLLCFFLNPANLSADEGDPQTLINEGMLAEAKIPLVEDSKSAEADKSIYAHLALARIALAEGKKEEALSHLNAAEQVEDKYKVWILPIASVRYEIDGELSALESAFKKSEQNGKIKEKNAWLGYVAYTIASASRGDNAKGRKWAEIAVENFIRGGDKINLAMAQVLSGQLELDRDKLRRANNHFNNALLALKAEDELTAIARSKVLLDIVQTFKGKALDYAETESKLIENTENLPESYEKKRLLEEIAKLKQDVPFGAEANGAQQ